MVKNDMYLTQRNQRLSVERQKPHFSNIGDFPRANLDSKLNDREITTLLLKETKSILPEYLTSVGRKSPIRSLNGLEYNFEK